MGNCVRLCSVGDLMICDSPLYVSVGVGTNYSKIKGRLFADCNQIFEDSDFVIGNFEGCFYEPKKQSLDELQMSCDESILSDLSEIGFNILNFANNHCMQHGVSAFLNADKLCKENGIKALGYKNECPYVVKINDMEFVFLSLCLHYERYDPDHILYEDNIIRIFSEVKEQRKKRPDCIIILSVHWGDEFATYPSNSQIMLGHKFADAGVNIILGHHSHVFQGIEKYKNTVIAYGQGNFVSDMKPVQCRETAIVTFNIADSENIDYELHPFYINNNFVPESAGAEWFAKRQNEMKNALSGNITDSMYWEQIMKNHRHSHSVFRDYFMSHLTKYRLSISLKMIMDFAKRKIHRASRNSTFGVNGSYDPEIYKALELIHSNGYTDQLGGNYG